MKKISLFLKYNFSCFLFYLKTVWATRKSVFLLHLLMVRWGQLFRLFGRFSLNIFLISYPQRNITKLYCGFYAVFVLVE